MRVIIKAHGWFRGMEGTVSADAVNEYGEWTGESWIDGVTVIAGGLSGTFYPSQLKLL